VKALHSMRPASWGCLARLYRVRLNRIFLNYDGSLCMRVALGLVFFLCVGAYSRVLADTPPPASSSTPAPASASTTAPAATGAKPPVAAEAKAEAVSADGVTKEELKRLHVAGYKQKTRGDQIVYCRVEAVLGTRFDREMCATARDLEFIRSNSRELATQMQKGNFGVPKVAPGTQ
jgi:hypothetical protein